MKRRQRRRPSARAHIAGDERSWDVTRVRLRGLESVVKREAAVERILTVQSATMCDCYDASALRT